MLLTEFPYIDLETFMQRANAVSLYKNEIANKIVEEISQIYYETIMLKFNKEINASLGGRIVETMRQIDTLQDLPGYIKMMLKIWSAENYSIWINKVNCEQIVDEYADLKVHNPFSFEHITETRLDFMQTACALEVWGKNYIGKMKV